MFKYFNVRDWKKSKPFSFSHATVFSNLCEVVFFLVFPQIIKDSIYPTLSSNEYTFFLNENIDSLNQIRKEWKERYYVNRQTLGRACKQI